MRKFWVLAAAIAAVLGAGASVAQTVRDIPGPAENPPGSFRDAQYVDSRGCVFVRAGVDGRTVWVPRVNAERKVLCGYPPSITAAAAAPVAPPKSVEPVAAPAPVVQPAKPTKPARVAQSTTRQKQANDYIDAPRAGSKPGTLRCPARAPIAERVPLASGGTVILCVSRAGLVGAATLPDVALASQPRPLKTATPTAAPRSQTANAAPLRLTLTEPDDAIDLVKPVVPKGYKLAWQDDRLNARRAQGTERGQAQQNLVWTQETPARLVTRAERAKLREQQATLTLSTKGAPAKPRYVQVGSFGDPANAQAASATLSGLGLPVAKARAKSGGRQLQVVLAGPFSSDADAAAALRVLRRGEFPDAVIR
jgi:hypothetical protein